MPFPDDALIKLLSESLTQEIKKGPNATLKVGKEKYWQTKCEELRAELNTLRSEKVEGYYKQEDVRRIINRALRANNLKPLPSPRFLSKTRFVSAVTDHLWEVLNVQEPRAVPQLQGDGEGQEGEQSW